MGMKFFLDYIARQISRDYRGQSLVLVGVLKGITFFLADLARQIKVPFVIDYLDLQRFAGAQPRDRVRIVRDTDYPIEGRHVLLVEDIVNTGFTLDYVLSELRRRQPITRGGHPARPPAPPPRQGPDALRRI